MRPKLCYKFLSTYSKGLPFSGFVRVFALEFVNTMKGSREKYENYTTQVLKVLFLLDCNKKFNSTKYSVLKNFQKCYNIYNSNKKGVMKKWG